MKTLLDFFKNSLAGGYRFEQRRPLMDLTQRFFGNSHPGDRGRVHRDFQTVPATAEASQVQCGRRAEEHEQGDFGQLRSCWPA